MNKQNNNNTAEKQVFRKEQLLKSGIFNGHIDAANAVLRENTEYSKESAQAAVKEFLERKVM